MRDTPHARLLCMLMFVSLSRSAPGVLAELGTQSVKALLEELAEEVLTFFSDADSFDRNWLMPKSDEIELFEKGAFHLSFEEEESDAVEKAEYGDYRSLEKLLLERGYLRSTAARRLAVDRMRGVRKRGSPKTKANLETLMEIAALQVSQGCTEYRAKALWLEQNTDISSDTLDTRLKRAKKLSEAEGIVTLLNLWKANGVQKSDNSEP